MQVFAQAHERQHPYCVPATREPLAGNILNTGEMSDHLRCVLFLVNLEELKSKTLEWLQLMRDCGQCCCPQDESVKLVAVERPCKES